MDYKKLDKAMLRFGTTNAFLARKCNVAGTTVMRWRRGEIPIPKKHERKISYLFGIKKGE